MVSMRMGFDIVFTSEMNSNRTVSMQQPAYLNIFAASYLNTQGLNNSCLKSPASTLVDLTFQSSRSALSA